MVCPGRHTLSGLITVCGGQFVDWTADYGLYSKDRVSPEAIFRESRREVESLGQRGGRLHIAIDDTILRKRGRCIPGTAYRRDPLGPRFQVNLVWAQRMLQVSGAVLDEAGEVRMVPIHYQDASTPRKPRKGAPPEALLAHREAMRQRNLNALALAAVAGIQSQRAEENGGTAPPLHALVDGSYTNRNMLRNLPEKTVLIGRIRKDAKLNAKPAGQTAFGRRRIYGQDLPTPEQIRQDPGIPWQSLQVRVNGKSRKFEIKTLSPVRWRAAGEIDLRLLVIRPVGFRPRKGARMSYTRPAYLICTDAQMPADEILQEYVWRWDIEVNHREEKTILGVGQAQVRNPNSVQDIPASAVAAYAMLHLAAIKAYGKGGKPAIIPEAKWRRPWKKIRPSTQDLLNELRRELWANAIRQPHLSDFMTNARQHTKSLKSAPDLCSTLFAATA
jgi:hypothetical protein